MRRFENRLPIVLSTTALVVALFGAGVPSAVAHGVKHALFAHNAAKVDGISASKTPKPGKLVPLGPDGKFPESVGAIGPQGPAGPQGTPGAPGVDGIGLTWRGEWTERGRYAPQDVVFFHGSAWIAIRENTASPPTGEGETGEGTWDLLASAGADGAKGDKGDKGDPGDFTGVFTSDNGQYSLKVLDTGFEATGPGGSVKIGAAAVELVGSGGGVVRVIPGSIVVQGSLVALNGCSKPVARVGDTVATPDAPFDLTPANSTIPLPDPLFIQGLTIWQDPKDPQYLYTTDPHTMRSAVTSNAEVDVPNGSIAGGSATVCTG